MGNCLRSSAAAASPSLTSSPTTASHMNKNIHSGISNSSTSNTARSSKTSSSSASSKSRFSSGSSATASAGGDETYPDGRILATPNLRRFTFQELKAATRNFKPDTLLGEGGFGKVYKGWLDHDHKQPSSSSSSSSHTHRTATPTLVAIKKLNSESLQGFEEWQTEIDFLGRLSHPNLVKLLGYCWEDSELLLVYEFLQRGSLENHLFGRGSAVQPLPWELRIKIAIGVARGFAFLHASDDRVIFRDMKAANILLDGVYNAKISDFGLAKLGPSASQSHVTTRIMGTYGYAAPEYVATGHLYIKSDVYGFGVVLVELLTGLRALDTTRPSGQHTLVDWIKPYLSDKRKLKGIMDSRLEGKYPSKAAMEMAQLALNCLAQEPRSRPSMQEAFQILDALDRKLITHRDRQPHLPKKPLIERPPTRQSSQLPLPSHHRFPRSRR